MAQTQSLNLDVFLLVGEHVESCPDFMIRWAMVCKQAYEFFTSDKIWKRYNPYRLDHGIYQHFMATCTPQDLQLLRCEKDPELGYLVPGSRYERETQDTDCAARNWYLWTAILLGRLTAMHPVIEAKPLVLTLNEMDPEFWKYNYVADHVYEDLALVREVCKANPCAYMYHELWNDDKQLALEVLQHPCPHRHEHHLYCCSTRLRYDPDIKQAIASNKAARRILLLLYYDDDEGEDDAGMEVGDATQRIYSGMDSFLESQVIQKQASEEVLETSSGGSG